MLFDYTTPASQLALQPQDVATVWSRFPLQPLAPGALTPFSTSVLTELAGRAWYLYYDRLGFDPAPRAKVVRHYKGRVYFNLSLCAQLEADHAGVEPLSLRVNGTQQPLATWEKPGFLAGLKLGRAQKKIDETTKAYARRIGEITDSARTWYLKTQQIRRWGQAEVLQVMEEIERVGVDSMLAFFAARYHLGLHTTRLAADLSGTVTAAQASLLINEALCETSGLVEVAMLDALPTLAEAMRDPETVKWLKAGEYAEWREKLPNQDAVEQVKHFLDSYGHRAAHEGEIAYPRWSEDATLLLQALLAYVEQPANASATGKANRAKATSQPLLEKLPSSARKQGEQTLHKIGELQQLQSTALHALTYIWAGTRTWALAAAREAMVDNRLQSQEEVFLFELEEIKEMMTGEWNISSLAEIHAIAAQRRIEHAAIQQEVAPELLVGDSEAFAAARGLPGVAGKASAPVRRLDRLGHNLGNAKRDLRDTIVATELLDSGCTLMLPLAAGFVAATGSPCDPFVAAAHGWQRPVVVALGSHYGELQEGAPVVIEVGQDVVGQDVVGSDVGADAVKITFG